MFRVRALLTILVLLVGSVLAAGCARTDQPGAAGPGDTTVTIPPPTSATPSPPAPTSTIPRAPAVPLLV
jgi:hypothetical protein